jgi:hypothetical protein
MKSYTPLEKGKNKTVQACKPSLGPHAQHFLFQSLGVLGYHARMSGLAFFMSFYFFSY